MTIPLIQTQDGFEAVRDAIANILATESANQVAAAIAWNNANPTLPQLDPDEWKLSVFTERSNPLELFRHEDSVNDLVVNVWYDTSNTDNAQSYQANQVTVSQINVDCIATGVSTETSGGHDCGDELAYRRAQAVARLCRRILMHPSYRQLGLTSIVRTREMSTRRSFRANSPELPSPHAAGVQLQFDVKHNEGFDFEALSDAEGALITIYREPDGQVIAQMDYDWTA